MNPFSSLNHVVSASLEGCRDVNAQRICRFHVKYKLKGSRLQYREIIRFCALQNSTCVNAVLPIGLRKARTVTEQPTHGRKFAERVNRWDSQAGCIRHDLLSLHHKKGV